MVSRHYLYKKRKLENTPLRILRLSSSLSLSAQMILPNFKTGGGGLMQQRRGREEEGSFL